MYFLKYCASRAATELNVQHEPQSPWFCTGFTKPFARQSNSKGRALEVMFFVITISLSSSLSGLSMLVGAPLFIKAVNSSGVKSLNLVIPLVNRISPRLNSSFNSFILMMFSSNILRLKLKN